MKKFVSNILYPSKNLPLTLILLEDWVPIVVNGENSLKYLQEQFTGNLLNLHKNQYIFSSHCNANGKTISNMCIFYYKNNITYLIRRSLYQLQLKELKKYAIFEKINIFFNDKIILLGLAGINSKETLVKIFGKLPNKIEKVMHYDETTLIYFNLPKERYLLVTNYKMYKNLLKQLPSKIKFNNSLQWLALEMESGYPLIDKINSMKFLPQSINLQILGGIDFKKGCYLGQEIIARTEYKKINKFNLFLLEGENDVNYNLTSGDSLILYNQTKIFNTGIILAICKLFNNKIWIQAILNNKLLNNNLIKVNNKSNNFLFIKKLPYL